LVYIVIGGIFSSGIAGSLYGFSIENINLSRELKMPIENSSINL
jgi:hypothetical protein